MEEKNYKISITGEGYQVKDMISKAQLARIIAIITSDMAQDPFNDLNNSSPTRRNPSKKRSGVSTFAPVQVRKEIEDLQLDPIHEEFGNYWSISQKSSRLLWILAVLSTLKFESLNQKELSIIAEKLGDNIPPKSMTALLDPNKKASRVAPSLVGNVRTVRILKPGLDYVKSLVNSG